METCSRIVGGLLLLYAAVYLAQYWGSQFYDNPQVVWDVLNVLSAVGIIVALAVNIVHRLMDESGSATVLLCANAVLAIWFFHNWFGLLTLEAGESVSVHANVVWDLIAAMIPVVLTATGWRLLSAKG